MTNAVLTKILETDACRKEDYLDLTLRNIERNHAISRDYVLSTRTILISICKRLEADDNVAIAERHAANERVRKESIKDVLRCSDKDLLKFLVELWRRDDAS